MIPLSSAANYQITPTNNSQLDRNASAKERILSKEVEKMATDMSTANCNVLSVLEPDAKRAFFVMSYYLQSPHALSFVIGPHCSYLGEVQTLAFIDDPLLTAGNEKEILYYSPSLNLLFVSFSSINAIAYAFENVGDDPLEYFLNNRDKAESYASTAKRFAQFAASIRSPVAASSSTSSTPEKTTVKRPVRRPVQRTSSSTAPLYAAPTNQDSSTEAIAIEELPEETADEPQEELPDITPRPQTAVFEASSTISIWQVIIGIGVIALLVFVYTRRRVQESIIQD